MKDTIEKSGIPKQIVSDHGSDNKSGIERFCQAFPGTRFVYDITHKAAALLKRELDFDERWKSFIANTASTRKKVQQTTLAAIAPPNQRSKARYMNVDTLIKWGIDKLHFMDTPESIECLDCTKDYLDEKFGWLKEFHKWGDIVTVVKEAEMFLKFQGFYNGCHHDLKILPTFTARTGRGKTNPI